MNKDVKAALILFLQSIADDEMLLGHRDGEWTGHAPILEEDIAFANISQDEIGHAATWYHLIEQLNGRSPDQLVFFRDAPDWRHASLVELPKGDWAFTIVRQYLFDAMEQARLASLRGSSYQPLADVAVKIHLEELYHLRHSQGWVERLGDATEESHERMQFALNHAWPYALGLFEPIVGEELLVAEGIKGAEKEIEADWLAMVEPVLSAATLIIPETAPIYGGRKGKHTEHLPILLGELQKVARLIPGATW